MAEMLRRGEGSIRGVRGVNLAYRTWEKPNARAALMVVHGLGEHAGRYAEFGERMASFGISTFAMDLRGHGLSDGRRGHVSRFDVHLQEIDRFRREVEGLADLRVPLFLFGQSMGGLIALRYLEEYEGRFRGAIIASPWLATAMPVPRWKVAAASLLNRLLPALPLRHGIEPDHLTHDTEVVERYRGDPLVHGYITPRTFAEASAAMGLVLQRSDRISEPLLFLLGGDDRIVDTGRSLHFARAITGRDVTVKVCAGQYHEVHNEIDRPAIHREIREWIMARV
jgi:alpha-beta hydrolase superfamily lysophospholipase